MNALARGVALLVGRSTVRTAPAELDPPNERIWRRETLLVLWIFPFTLHFGVDWLKSAPGRFLWAGEPYVAPWWLVSLQQSASFATLILLLLVLAGGLSKRIRVTRYAVIAPAVGAAVVLSLFALAYLDLVACLTPWGQCRTGMEWIAVRFITFQVWLTFTLPLVLASVVAREVGRHGAEEIRASQLRSAVTEAQVSALALQLQPHFLFNTLQSVATLMHRDPEAADQMLQGVEVLFRNSLDLDEGEEICLADELALLRLYTDIEAVRFGDRMVVVIDADPAAARASVPRLLLQPIVENSIRHAVAITGTGRVEVAAKVDASGAWLEITVRDSGPGILYERRGRGFGLGIANTRARLEARHGSAVELKRESFAGEGTMVLMRIPYVPCGYPAAPAQDSPG